MHFYVLDFYNDEESYKSFRGYPFSKLLEFCRTLYGGGKIQNHALNNRLNFEFSNKVGSSAAPLIITLNGKYLINIQYIIINGIDTSKTVCAIIEKYIELLSKKDNLLESILEELMSAKDVVKKKKMFSELLTDDSEARIFEIISYAILKNHYKDIFVYFGWEKDKIEQISLKLYKTGRTNANDGGIDFVMRPIGRFFQVTEVDNYDKYFLDIDKILHYPVTFVVKTCRNKEDIMSDLQDYTSKRSGGMLLLKERYQAAIEEIITINELRNWLDEMCEDQLSSAIKDIDLYYKLELNVPD